MLSTKPLSSLKGFIHQPLPLTQRESQRLLNALTNSFRKNLDREHGFTEDADILLRPANKAARPANPAPNTTIKTTTSHSHHPHRRPTDHHLRAVLSNPLFVYDRASEKVTSSALRDPMAVFDEAVAKGMMTMTRATGCLVAKQKQIQDSDSLSIATVMGSAGAGLKVLNWLKSAGLERNLSFLHHVRFTQALVQFLVAEGLEGIVWTWIERCLRANNLDLPTMYTVQGAPIAAWLLARLTSSHTYGAQTLDNSYTAMIHADMVFKAHGNQMAPPMLYPAWRKLSEYSTLWAWKWGVPEVKLFDKFTQMASVVVPPKRRSLEEGHLSLHHPQHPDPTMAVQVLDRLTGSSKRDEAGSAALPRTPKIISMALDAVQVLTRGGQLATAQHILDLLDANVDAHVEPRQRNMLSFGPLGTLG